MDSQSHQPVTTATPGVVTENPQIEMASEDGRVIAWLPGQVHPGELPIEYARRPLPFAARFQAILIVVMFAGCARKRRKPIAGADASRRWRPGGGRSPPAAAASSRR